MKSLLLNSWYLVMDNRYNPLRHATLGMQHYLMQIKKRSKGLSQDGKPPELYTAGETSIKDCTRWGKFSAVSMATVPPAELPTNTAWSTSSASINATVCSAWDWVL